MKKNAKKESREGIPRVDKFRLSGPSRCAEYAAIVAATLLAALIYLKFTQPFDDGSGDEFNKKLDAVAIALVPAGITGVSYLIFYFWRWYRITRFYLNRVKRDPTSVIPTAGSVFSDIVGRDELCHMLIQNVRRDNDTPRPNVVVGGGGRREDGGPGPACL